MAIHEDHVSPVRPPSGGTLRHRIYQVPVRCTNCHYGRGLFHDYSLSEKAVISCGTTAKAFLRYAVCPECGCPGVLEGAQ